MNIIKYLQAQGIDTRKGCQWLVKHQLVQINGDTIASDKAEVQPENVRSLSIEGEDALIIPLPHFYILLNKPADYEVSHKRATTPACSPCCPTKSAPPTSKPSGGWMPTPQACY